jgi:hypothetical protein
MTMTMTKAFQELDAIRNDRSSETAELIARVDAVGHWAAAQRRYTDRLGKVLSEAHDLHARLTGGPRSGKTTITMIV